MLLAVKALDLEEDSPELEAQLLKAADGPFEQYSIEETRELGERIICEKQSKSGQRTTTG